MMEITPEESTVYRISGLAVAMLGVQEILRLWMDKGFAFAVSAFVMIVALYFAVLPRPKVAFPLFLVFASAMGGFAYALSLLLDIAQRKL
jgi:hypothetical protein